MRDVFNTEDLDFLRLLIPEGARVLDIGCGAGHRLAALKPGFGVGFDSSAAAIAEAEKTYPHPHLLFLNSEYDRFPAPPGPFDVILVADTLSELDEPQRFFEHLHALCRRQTRLVVIGPSRCAPGSRMLAKMLGLRTGKQSADSTALVDMRGIEALADFDVVRIERRTIAPIAIFGLERAINRFVAALPLIRRLCRRQYFVCRSLRCQDAVKSATIVIPVRNERGNIENAIVRIPVFTDIEIIFVEGHSEDGTWEEIERVIASHPDRDIKAIRQPGEGKSDAVFAGFNRARGDVLMILDGDLTVPPEQLPEFWQAISSKQGEFVNGSRLVYPRAPGAMRFLNLIANKLFAAAFSWLLSQRMTDVLCGTKALRREDFRRFAAVSPDFGAIDPFGDFDLIVGAATLGLKFVEIPIRYDRRAYGEPQIRRFRHGLKCLQALLAAFLRTKMISHP